MTNEKKTGIAHIDLAVFPETSLPLAVSASTT